MLAAVRFVAAHIDLLYSLGGASVHSVYCMVPWVHTSQSAEFGSWSFHPFLPHP